MSLPTPHVLHVKRLIEGAENAHGNPEPSYAAPQEWHVHGIAPGASERPDAAHRDASHILYTVYAPPNGEAPGTYDLVVVNGEDFGVEGEPADWTKGPWPHPTAGLVVELKRVEG